MKISKATVIAFSIIKKNNAAAIEWISKSRNSEARAIFEPTYACLGQVKTFGKLCCTEDETA